MAKSSKGFAHLILIIVIMLVGIVVVGYFTLNQNSFRPPLLNQNKTSQIETTPALEVSMENLIDETKSQGGLLFLGTYNIEGSKESKWAVFTTNSERRNAYLEGRTKFPYIGSGVELYFGDIMDLKEIRDLNEIYVDEREIKGVVDVYQALQNNKVYATLYYPQGPESKYEIDEIHQIDTSNMETTKVWEFVRGSDKYVGQKIGGGYAIIENVVQDKYILISISTCKECNAPYWPNSLLYNIKNQNEKILGVVGNVTIDPQTGTVKYQKVELVDCGEEDSCIIESGTKKEVPTGPIITEELP